MIYGNKFLDNNLLLSESMIIKEEENINLLIKDLLMVTESQDSIEKICDVISDKFEELSDKIDFYINKFISFVKVKILKLGNKILKKLDEVINGKFEVKDLPDIESEYKKDFDNGGEYKEIIESVIAESNSERKISFVSFKSPRSLIENWSEYTFNDLDKAEEFMGVAQKYLDDSVEYLNGNHTDSIINKLDAYSDQFKEDYKDRKASNKEKDDLIYGLMYDMKEVKSFKGDQSFSTSNGHFNIDFFDISNKEDMKGLRSLVFSQIKYLEKQIDILTKCKSMVDRNKKIVSSFVNKSSRVLNNVKGDKYTHIDSPNTKYKYISLYGVETIAFRMTDMLSNDYKACTTLINASIYVTKSNYRTAIQAIRFWGGNTQGEQ